MSEAEPGEERERKALRYFRGEHPTQHPLGTDADRLRIPHDDPSEAATQDMYAADVFGEDPERTQEMGADEVLPLPTESERIAASFAFGGGVDPERTQEMDADEVLPLPSESERIATSFAFGEEDSEERVATSFAFGPAGYGDDDTTRFDDGPVKPYDFDEDETLGDDRPGPQPVGPAPEQEHATPEAGVGARLFMAGLLSAAELGGDRGRATPRHIGRYERIESLGKGGTAEVYRVRDPEAPERELALKLLSKDLLDPSAQARFEREAEILSRVRHPNVVKLYDVGRVEAGSYIVLEQIPGTPLDEGEEELTPERVARVLERLAEAVQALHDAGVFHRDIKPDNVILRLDGEPVLLDFGTAKDLRGETLTRTGDFLGTPEYVAPEEVGLSDRSTLTPAVDVYGLGALMYFLLTGRPPFSGSPLLILEAVQNDDPAWPRTLDPQVPEPLDAICRRAMAKDPTQRYPTAQALQLDLQRYQCGKRPRALSRGGLLPLVVALGGLLSLGLGVLVAWLLTR